MPKFTREVEIDAVQFTGNNWKTVQDFVGVRQLDPKGKYSFPLFDESAVWMPNVPDPETHVAVVQVRGTWQPVKAGDWIIRENTDIDTFAVLTDEQFISTYGQPVQAKRTTRKKKS